MTFADLLQKMRDPREAVKTALVATTVTVLSIFGTQTAGTLLNAVTSRLEYPMVLAEIERVREDLHHVDCASAAMLLNKAMEYNIRIAHEQNALTHWYSRWAIPQGWTAVSIIRLPCGEAGP